MQNVEDLYPLSPMQEGMLFHSLLDRRADVYFRLLALRVHGRLDARCFVRAWQLAVSRHSILRTAFLWDGLERPLQVVRRKVHLPVAVVDGQTLAPEDRRRLAKRLVAERRSRGLDLGQAPLLGLVLLRWSADQHQLIWSFHHLLLDAWSRNLLLAEIQLAYRELSLGRQPALAPATPFREVIRVIREQDPALAERFWRAQLEGFSRSSALPLARPGGGGSGHHQQLARLPAVSTAALAERARRERLTVGTLAHGAWALTLARLGGEAEVLFGTVVAGRSLPLAGVESMLGLFINTMPLRVVVDPRIPLSGWLAELQGRLAELRRFEHSSLAQIQGWSEVPRGQPLFESLLVFENAPAANAGSAPGEQQRPGRGLSIDEVEYEDTNNFPLTLTVAPGESLLLRLELARDRFDRGAGARLAHHLVILLAAMAEQGDAALGELSWFSAVERHQLLHEWNDSGEVGAVPPLVATLAAGSVEVPDAVALVAGDETLSCGELWRRAFGLAARLRSIGVGPEVSVAICMERSPELVVGLLAVLAAGGAYLPLDPAFPAPRLAFMMADSGSEWALVDSANRHQQLAARQILVGSECGAWSGDRVAAPPESDSAALAYLLYTSGSTGRPKGVLIPRLALASFLAAMARSPGLVRHEVLLAITTISFDIAGLELFLPLWTQARLELVDRATAADGSRLLAALARSRATVMQATPASWRMLLEAGWGEAQGAGRLRVLCGGEVLPGALAAELGRRGREVWNLFGPTETTIWSSLARLGGEEVTVGRPIARTLLVVLDRRFEVVPNGVAGELFIGGIGLARGYLGRAGLTAERFLASPLGTEPGARLYRTGDLARFGADGRLEHLGRVDLQVKVRGFRIEPGEVEAALEALSPVAQAAVLAVPDTQGELELVACVVPRGAATPSAADLAAGIASKLPAHLLPSRYLLLPELPRTVNEKLDRRALSRLAAGDRGSRPAPEVDTLAATSTEEVVAAIWCEVLGLPRVGVFESFFDLGGHSLLATRVVARLRQRLAVELELGELFAALTVARLAARIDELKLISTAIVAAIPLRPRDGELPLSFAQQRLWVLDRLHPGSPLFNLHLALSLAGGLDVAALVASLRQVCQRHEALRTALVEVAGRATQRILPPVTPPVALVDLSALEREVRAELGSRLRRRGALRPFDLTRPPLLRALLLRAAPQEHSLLLGTHHIASDAWSLGLLVSELAEHYRAFVRGERSRLAPLPIQYADFACWQRQWLQGEVLAGHLAYWRQALAGALEPLALPTDRPRGVISGAARPAASRQLGLSPELTLGLHGLARREGATPFILLLVGFQLLLGRLSGRQRLAVGSPIANRTRLETEGLIGFFVNMLALPADLTGNPTLRQLLHRVRTSVLAAYAHQDLPFEKLVEELGVERSASHTPLFQAVLALQNTPAVSLELPGLTLSRQDLDDPGAKFELALVMVEAGGSFQGRLTYASDLFDATTAERWLRGLESVLTAMVAHPSAPLSQVCLLTPAETQQLLWEWGERREEGGSSRLSLAGLVAARAEEAADGVALSCEDEQLSYCGLLTAARRLAGRLQAHGVGPEVPVAIVLERSLELVVAIVSTLGAGGVYVPIDPDAPEERLELLLRDSGAAVVLTSSPLAARLPAAGLRLLILDDDASPEPPPPTSWPLAWGGDGAAYVIYTSGSTGRPKGVVVSHHNVLRLFTTTHQPYRFGRADVWTLFHSYAFDFSVWEIFGALLYGGRLVVVPYWCSRSPRDFARLLVERAVTVLNQTPSAFYPLITALTDQAAGRGTLALRWVIFGGEALEVSALEPWWRLMGGSHPGLVNMFGITETTVHVTLARLDETLGHGRSPVGRPIPDLEVQLVDRELQPVGIGVAGELLVGGAGLARGYLNRPALTAGRFVPHAWAKSPGERLYRSGDLARRTSAGELDYLGRIDEQVKIRGFRIELGEIAAALRAHPAVREAAVVLADDGRGGKRLVAYGAGSDLPAPRELRAFLARRLPDYMLPETFVALAALPLTVNGKLDRRALPPLQGPLSQPGREGANAGSISTPTEELVAGAFAEVLGREVVGRDESFFDLGGHSLLAVRVASRLSVLFGLEVPLPWLFEWPVVADLAAQLDHWRRHSPSPEASGLGDGVVPFERVPREQVLPLSFAQEQIWWFQRREPSSGFYNLPFAVRVEGELDPVALARAGAALVRRHEALRTCFSQQGGEPRQRVLAASPWGPALIDLRALGEAERSRLPKQLAQREAERPFELERGELLRCTLLRLEPGAHALLATTHHIACDAWSLDLLVAELGALYAAEREGRPVDLPALVAQPADLAHWQRRALSGATLERLLDYGRRIGRDLPRVELPTDFPRPPVLSRNGARQPLTLAAALVSRFRVLGREQGATLFMTLLAAFEILLGERSGQTDLVVGTNVAGRGRPESEGVVGCFINQLLLRTSLAEDPTYLELLARVRATCLEAYAHQELPFDRLVAELEPPRDPSRPLLFQIKFELLNNPSRPGRFPGLRLEPLGLERPVVRYDLHLLLTEIDGRVSGSLQYNTDLFSAATVAALVADYGWLLEAVAAAPESRLSSLEAALALSRRRAESARRQERRLDNVQSLKNLKPRAGLVGLPSHLNREPLP